MTTRALGALRLSKSSDASTSIARQRERVDWWISGNGAELVAVTEDVSVSGSVSPFERAGIGPYLTDNPPQEWDVLVAWKLDRISRSAIDTLHLLKWCEQRGKRIVTTDDGIDTATANGRVFVQLAAIFAEVERTNIVERVLSSRDKLRREGRWSGGAPVYGMMAVRHGGGYTVVRDPDTYEHLRFMVDRAIAGDSLNSIAASLNNREIPAPSQHKQWKRKDGKRARWRPNTITGILSSPTLLGNMAHNGATVHGPDGMPVKAGEAVVSLAEWRQLQARFESAPARTRTDHTSPLLDIAFCARCGAKMYSQRAVRRGVEYRYYRCRTVTTTEGKCSARSVRAEYLESRFEQMYLEQLGDREVVDEQLIPGEDHTAELAEAQTALAELASLAGSARSESARRVYTEQLEALDARIANLEALPHRGDTYVPILTGETFRQVWENSDETERRRFMVASGIRVLWAGTHEPHVLPHGAEAVLTVPEEWGR